MVDIGAGTAPYRKLFKCEKYIGVDVEDRGGVEDVVIADVAESIPLSDSMADIVLCSETLEHIKEPERALQEIHRILKKNGTLLLTTPFVWPIHEAPEDYYRYTRYGLAHLLEKTGFSEIMIKPSSGFFTTLCEAIIIPLKGRSVFIPFVFFMNILGYATRKKMSKTELPLGYHTIAQKK